jgi:hypothetical protein
MIPENVENIAIKVKPVFGWKTAKTIRTFDVTLTSASDPYEIDYGDGTEENPDCSSANMEIIGENILRVRVDSNNDGEVNEADDNLRVKNCYEHPGHIMVVLDENDEHTRSRVELFASVPDLTPKPGLSNIEIDIYLQTPAGLSMWDRLQKGQRVLNGYDIDEDGRIDVGLLGVLSQNALTFQEIYYVQADEPVVTTLGLCAQPTAGPAGSDGSKITAIAIDFIDSAVNLQWAGGNDSANFFLRQHVGAVPDYQNLDIRYKILPANAVELEYVKIKIYQGDMGARVTSIYGHMDDKGKYMSGDGLRVIWDDVRDGNGAFRDVGFYTIQIEVKIADRAEIIKTPVGDADAGADWPGFQCKDRCLVIHDLVYKHRPCIHMATAEPVAPNGPIYPFSGGLENEYKLLKRGVGGFGFAAWSPPPINYSDSGSFPSISVTDRKDFTKNYPVLTASINNDKVNAASHYIDMASQLTTVGDPTLFHRGHILGNYCFIQYWMFETQSYSFARRGIMNNWDTEFWHDGDWEMIQICIKLNHIIPNTSLKKRSWCFPYAATASQHYYGQTLAWRIYKNGPQNVDQQYVSTADNGNRINIYIAEGSHAAYFRSGEINGILTGIGSCCGTQVQYDTTISGYYDRILSYGTSIEADIVPLNSKSDRGIGDWPGKWGASGYMPGTNGPASPFYRTAKGKTQAEFYLDGDPVRLHNECRKEIGNGVLQPDTEL